MPGKTTQQSRRGGKIPRTAPIRRTFSLVNRGAVSAPKVETSAPAVSAAVAVNAVGSNQGVVGVPRSMMEPGLRPIARLEIMSTTRIINFNGGIGVLTATAVADPTGTAANSLGVDGWMTRFGGFQQYRIRKTKWILVPLRTNVGTGTSSQGPGHVGVWIQDTPQTGAPTTSQFFQANREMVLCNTDHIKAIEYATNEPQDLNMSDITLPPSHVTGAGVELGQHCYQTYGDIANTGMTGWPGTSATPAFSITALYDIEFFGVGGV